jgi:excisionase family DNA binding protein
VLGLYSFCFYHHTNAPIPVRTVAVTRREANEDEMNIDELTGALTVTEFCQTFNVGRTFFYQEIKSGRLTAVKAGTKTLILKPEAARWARSLPKLQTHKSGATAALADN